MFSQGECIYVSERTEYVNGYLSCWNDFRRHSSRKHFFFLKTSHSSYHRKFSRPFPTFFFISSIYPCQKYGWLLFLQQFTHMAWHVGPFTSIHQVDKWDNIQSTYAQHMCCALLITSRFFVFCFYFVPVCWDMSVEITISTNGWPSPDLNNRSFMQFSRAIDKMDGIHRLWTHISKRFL